MSEIRIGVAAEGPTDIVVIQTALDKILESPYVITHIVIVHVDADIGRQNYAQANIQNPPKYDLPCGLPCPPASATVQKLETVVLGWLNLENGQFAPKP